MKQEKLKKIIENWYWSCNEWKAPFQDNQPWNKDMCRGAFAVLSRIWRLLK